MTSRFRTRSFLISAVIAVASAVEGAPPSAVQSAPANFSKERAALLDGVTNIASPGVPGSFCIFSDRAFAVVGAKSGGSRAAVVSAARAGKGRIVALAHGGYFGSARVADTGKLFKNALAWLAESKNKKPGEIVVGIHGDDGLAVEFRQHGYPITILAGEGWIGRLPVVDVLVTRAADFTKSEINQIQQFIEAGGGFLTSDLGWGWLQLNPGKTLADFPSNVLLRKYGIVYTGSYAEPDSEKFISAGGNVELLEANAALDRMSAGPPAPNDKLKKKEVTQASFTLTEAARALPADDLLFLPKIEKLMKERGADLVPSEKKPLAAADGLARCLLTFEIRALERVPASQVTEHPAAKEFPGSVPAGASVVSKILTIDTKIPGWHSTGLYAAPGAKIKVMMPADALPVAGAKSKLKLQIGCHRDELWHLDAWKRVPDIVRTFDLDQKEVTAANAFGGPVYLDIPVSMNARRKDGGLVITIDGAVEAPRFILGKTSNDEWKTRERNLPAPWAELETEKVILTIPSSVARKVNDPEMLMKYWNSVLDGAADLYGRPRERERAERYVADIQISAGYMHSGYPIMTHLDGADHMTDLQILHSDKGWGVYHELGHNHQEGDWTFEGTGEVTNNIFSVYAIEMIAGANVTNGDRSPEKRAARMKPYFAAGARFETWKKEPFLALDMYMQIKDAFGWDIYKKVFADYRKLSKSDRPKNDNEKRDRWMISLSLAAGKNLGPFFVAWGVPTSDAARKSIEELPLWLPENFPPK